jgi:hypothetical protein
MKLLLSFFYFLLFSNYLFAQDTSFVARSGTKLNDVLSIQYIYHYSEFRDGKVVFRNEKQNEVPLNYSRLLDEMHFIDKKGDTLALDKEPTVRLIIIATDTFYFDQGYILLLKSSNIVKLGMKQGFAIGDRRNHTGYDMMSSTSSVTSIGSLQDWRRSYEFEGKEEVRVSTLTQYYIGDRYNRFALASSKNLLDLFPNHATQLSKFCKEHKVDFQVKRDLEKLFELLNTLNPPL